MISEILPSLTDERMQAYIRTAQQQKQLLAEQMVQRYQRGWEVAREAAEILKRFGADRVVVFGSLLDQQRIHLRSDVDLAVGGLNSKYYFQAVARLQEIDSTFAVDLVEIDNSYLYIKNAIALRARYAIAQGIEL
ncbi:nucleotidyltransferase domain-containing protein [Gloeocapsopsis sp. IPPAS B-1203]|uniref:nucleotidyltransferase domain-containing protein n=1 Tax=Gloeocapsopsis sp. IPPAS B-1203 TaxID=2049454 RepID=UPI0011814061|nr:nucleotidyltransferase domain-containing protein [Gloeocapsopsis sp. IPPAS B-1203]